MKKIKQGDIFWANLDPVQGHEQAGMRPVLIIQNEILNQNLSTILIAPITSNLTVKGRLTTYFLSKKTSKLKQDSIALLYQLRCIDKSRLLERAGSLSVDVMREVKWQMGLLF